MCIRDRISSSFIEKNQYQLNKVENGLTFIRLVFPVQLNKSWNGNSMISSKTSIEVNGEILEPFDNWYYAYKYLNKSETLAGKIYASVCKVVEVDEENIIAKRYSETKYAKEVGMIFREPVSYTHLRAHETVLDLVCRLLLEKKKNNQIKEPDLYNSNTKSGYTQHMSTP